MIREVVTLSRLRGMPAEEAAALLTIRLSEGGAHEQDLFAQWLDLAPSNRAAWDRAQATWAIADRLHDDEMIEAMRDHARAAGPERRTAWRRYAAAAAVAAMVATGAILSGRAGLLDRPFGRSDGLEAQARTAAATYTFVSGRDLPKSFALADGSRMTLDADTRVTASFDGRARRVEVTRGRAFFAVHHEPARPFIVEAMNLRVTDVGTHFGIEVRPKDVRLILVEGQVSVMAPRIGTPILVSAGEELVGGGSDLPSLARSGADDATAWQRGVASFRNDTLAYAAAFLNRYPGPPLIVRSPQVRQLRISGTFKVGDSGRFGRALEQIYPVRLVRRPTGELEILPAS